MNDECLIDEKDEEQSGRTVRGEIVTVISATEYLSCKFCRCKAACTRRWRCG